MSRAAPLHVRWRGTTPVCAACDGIGLSFDLADGTVLRPRMSAADAGHVAATLHHYLSAGARQDVRCGGPDCQPAAPDTRRGAA